MRLWHFIALMCLALILQGYATEVVYMDYGDTDTGCISTYKAEEDCNCNYRNSYIDEY